METTHATPTPAAPAWQPGVPLGECIGADVDHAARLKRALRPFLPRVVKGERLSEMESDGVTEHQSAFAAPRPISGRWWRELVALTVDRDGGAHNWERLDIYLPRKQTPRVLPNSQPAGYEDLLAAVDGCKNPLVPNLVERELIERRTREKLAEIMNCGVSRKSAMREVCGVLAGTAPFIARSRNAIRCVVDRWMAEGKALGDGRQANTGNHDNYKLPLDDWRLITWCAVWRHNGRVADAWRELWHGAKFTAQTMQHFARRTRARKSDVPQSVMAAVRWHVDIFNKWRLGARGYNSARATIEVDHSVPVPPMLIVTADDMTPDFRYGVEVQPATEESPGRDKMVRGQILFFVDVGTLRIIGWVRAAQASYNALMILGELTRICKEIAVPAGCDWERGIWENARLLKGRPDADSASGRECRLERLGIKFKHAISPQGKAIMERTVRFMQEALAAVPGWTGNDEKVTCPDSTKKRFADVDSGKVRAAEAGFYTEANVDQLIREIVTRYNATRQEGKILNQLSPDEAWAKFLNPEWLPTKFTPELEYCLTHDSIECRVGINGVRPYSSGPIFWAEELLSSRFAGKTVRVWANVMDWSECGELKEVLVSDLDDNTNPFITAYPKTKVPRADWILDPDSGRLAQARRENAALEKPIKELLRELKASFNVMPQPTPIPTRATIGDSQATNTGRSIATTQASSPVKANRLADTSGQLASMLGTMNAGAGVGRRINEATEQARSEERAATERAMESQRMTPEKMEAAREAKAAQIAAMDKWEKNNAHLFG